MNATIRAGAPPGQESKNHVGKDVAFVKLQSFGRALQQNDNTIRVRWKTYAARRRLQRNRQGNRWPGEVVP